ncbi:MAG: hypothetical protein LBQ40_01370 [Clostridiales bacterium]|jgi:hypothetical protein|nr:hypothetical protein [Clostridiales bacterium]
MKPQRLEFFGLFNFSDGQVVDFGSFRDGCFYILGAHDSGKDVIADLLVYALFGRVGIEPPERYIINRKTKNGGVKLWFEHDGLSYCVERTFGFATGNKYAVSEAALYNVRGDVNYLAAEGVPAVDAKITELIGASADAYKKSAYINAYLAVGLLNKSDAEQLAYFGDYLGIPAFDEAFQKGLRDRLNLLKIKRAALTPLLDGALSDGEKERLLAEHTAKRLEYIDEIERLTQEKAETAQKLAEINAVVGAKKRLQELNDEIDALDAKKDYYDELEKKIKISDRAAKIIPAYKRREELIAANQGLELSRDELLSELAEAQAAFESADLERRGLEPDYEAAYAEYIQKRDALKGSLDNDADDDVKRQAEDSIKKDRAELAEIVGKKAELIKRLDFVNGECGELKKKINELTVDPELNYDMSMANMSEGSIKRLITERRYLEKKAGELDDKIDAATRRRELASERILAIKSEINKLGQEKFNLIGEGDIYGMFVREYRIYNRLAHQVGKVDTYNDNIKLLTKKKQTNIAEIERDTLELDRAEATRLNAEKNLYNVNSRSEAIQKEREKIVGVNYYVGVANGVRVGDFCPVCGNVTTLKQPKNPLTVVPVDMELNKLRDDRSRAEEILSNVIAVIAGLNSNILHMNRLNLDLDRDESFYTDCINDILKEEGFDSVQSLYEAYLKQKNKYESLKIIYDNAGAVIAQIDRLKDALRDAELEQKNADYEAAIYSEQYNERKYALAEVGGEYDRQMSRYTFLNTLSEYETPEKILERLEEMSKERLVFEKEYAEKTEVKRQLEKLIAECDSLEVLLLTKNKNGDGEATSYSELIVEAIKGRYSDEIFELLAADGRVEQARAALESVRKVFDSAADKKSKLETRLAAVSSEISANEKQIESLEKDYIVKIEGAEYDGIEQLEALVMGYFLYEDSALKLSEYKIRLNALCEERDVLASETDGCAAVDFDAEETAKRAAQTEENISKLKEALILTEYEIGHIGGKADNGRIDGELAEIQAETDLIEKTAALTLDGAYSGYVAAKNAESVLAAADRDVSALTNGRYGLAFADGIRVKDKLFDGKFRTLNTLDEREKLIVGVSIAAALAKAAANSANEILFVDGFDFFGPSYAADFKSIIKKLNESYRCIGVLVRESFEDSRDAIEAEISEGGSRIVAFD